MKLTLRFPIYKVYDEYDDFQGIWFRVPWRVICPPQPAVHGTVLSTYDKILKDLYLPIIQREFSRPSFLLDPIPEYCSIAHGWGASRYYNPFTKEYGPWRYKPLIKWVRFADLSEPPRPFSAAPRPKEGSLDAGRPTGVE